jgi:hypothetical protein
MPVLTGTPAGAAVPSVATCTINDATAIELEAVDVAAMSHLTREQLAAAMAEDIPEDAAAAAGGDSQLDEFDWEDAEEDIGRGVGATQRTAPALTCPACLVAIHCLVAATERCVRTSVTMADTCSSAALFGLPVRFVFFSHPQQAFLLNQSFLE